MWGSIVRELMQFLGLTFEETQEWVDANVGSWVQTLAVVILSATIVLGVSAWHDVDALTWLMVVILGLSVFGVLVMNFFLTGFLLTFPPLRRGIQILCYFAGVMMVVGMAFALAPMHRSPASILVILLGGMALAFLSASGRPRTWFAYHVRSGLGLAIGVAFVIPICLGVSAWVEEVQGNYFVVSAATTATPEIGLTRYGRITGDRVKTLVFKFPEKGVIHLNQTSFDESRRELIPETREYFNGTWKDEHPATGPVLVKRVNFGETVYEITNYSRYKRPGDPWPPQKKATLSLRRAGFGDMLRAMIELRDVK